MIKKAVIPMAGMGTRLYPLTKVINKALLPFGDKPIIYHLLDLLTDTSVEEVDLIIRPDDDLTTQLGYNYHNIKINYFVQKEFNGLAAALLEVEKHLKSEKFLLLLCDVIFTKRMVEQLLKKSEEETDSIILVHYLNTDVSSYGIAIIRDDGYINKVMGLNRQSNPSNYVITGGYILNYNIFELINNIKIDTTGEKNFNEVLNILAKNGQLRYIINTEKYYDVGTMKNYLISLRDYLSQL